MRLGVVIGYLLKKGFKVELVYVENIDGYAIGLTKGDHCEVSTVNGPEVESNVAKELIRLSKKWG